MQSIAGIYFDKYIQILKGLGIKIIIKTDNDITKVSRKDELTALGFNRCIDLFNLLCDCEEKEKLDNIALGPDASESTILEAKEDFRNKILSNKNCFDEFSRLGIYLSKIDLEHDLATCLDKDDKFVKDLQESKWINMWEFTKNATHAEAKKIFYHENFKCLKDLVDE